MIWYKYDSFCFRDEEFIKVVEVEKFTDKTVWIKGRRNSRSSQYDRYFPSFEEAKKFVIERFERRLQSAKDELYRCEARLQKIKNQEVPMKGKEEKDD